MPADTIILFGQVFDLPDAPWPPVDADTHINNLRYHRLRSRMATWLSRQPSPPSSIEFQAELNRLLTSFVFTFEPKEDEVEAEAISIAEDVIRAKLAEANMPPPRNLRDHAEQLLALDDSYRSKARLRVEARAQAAAQMAATLRFESTP